MPGCCVPQCTNHCRKGTRMYRFPASPNRRKRWLVQVKRDGWEPTAASRVCAAHFEDGSFEQSRLDGLKKLRPGAVPTLFPYRAAPKHRKSPRKRTCASRPANSSRAKRVCTPGDIPQLPLHPGDGKIPDHNAQSEKPLDKAANGADDTDELSCHRESSAASLPNLPSNNVSSDTNDTPEYSHDVVSAAILPHLRPNIVANDADSTASPHGQTTARL
ncbi:THAP domain-containing protein 7-like [Amblyomma americanum]